MTDRAEGMFVILEKPMRVDDLEATANAIKQIKGVLDVRYVFQNAESVSAAVRKDLEWRNRILDFVERNQ